jgi:endoglucanase
VPVTLQAENFATKTTGNPTADGYCIWSNGYIEDSVNFPVSGNYSFIVTASGSAAAGVWPEMEIRIDQSVIDTVTVNSAAWGTYVIAGNILAGVHKVAIAFTNDYYNPPEDRNLLVDSIFISSSAQLPYKGTVPVTLQAENFATKTTGGPTADVYGIWTNGYIEDSVNFPVSGKYSFIVMASGSAAAGLWPEMEIRIDQSTIDSVTVHSATWGTYVIEGNIPAGIHNLAIAFTNDYYNPPEDRNLYVDSVFIGLSAQLL